MALFQARAAGERTRIEAGEIADAEAARRMLARYEAKAAEWRGELERIQEGEA